MSKAKSLLENINGVPFVEAEEDDSPKKNADHIEGDDFSDLSYAEDTEKEDKPDDFTQSVLDILKHSSDPDEDFDAEQLEAGIKVETEHTSNKWIQKAIAKAHLAEYPDYYKALAAMEEELKKRKDSNQEKEEDELDV